MKLGKLSQGEVLRNVSQKEYTELTFITTSTLEQQYYLCIRRLNGKDITSVRATYRNVDEAYL